VSGTGHDPIIGVHAVIDAKPAGGVVGDGFLHAEQEAICPRCLSWITPRHYLRRNRYGLLEHDACPPSRRPA
jgi:hypothetical protein